MPNAGDWGRTAQSQGQSGGMTGMYDAAAETQAQDYDNIMKGYDQLFNQAGNNPFKGETYTRGADMNRLIGNLQNYSDTGGYSQAQLGDLRSRGVSPIRAAYSNAARNINRQKVLSGGYSPNAGALQAKLAREQGSLASQAATDVNAQIAQMVASGKLSGMQALSPALQQEAALQAGVNQRNAMGARENTQLNQGNQLNALQGKTSLYGTTPGLTNMFGSQVLQNNQQQLGAVQTANQIKNQRAGVGINVLQQANQKPGFRLG